MKKTAISLLLALALGISAPAGDTPVFSAAEDPAVSVEKDQKELLNQEPREEKAEAYIDPEKQEEAEAPSAEQNEEELTKAPEGEVLNQEETSVFLPEEDSIETQGDIIWEQQSQNVLQDSESQNREEAETDGKETEEYQPGIFTEENAELLTAEDSETEKILEEIEEGRMIAFTSASLEEAEAEEARSLETEEAMLLSLNQNRYRIYSPGEVAHCDEVWTASGKFHPRVRYIEYLDSDGKLTRSPLYCMKASSQGIDPGSGGLELKEEAVRFLNNSTLNKILYFGYGGPGDICGSYDPSCEHVDWSAWRNRYVFTHQALSKVYCNDVNGATEQQITHVGLYRFIQKIKSMTIPDRGAVKLRARNAQGNLITGNPMNLSMIYYRWKPSKGFEWLESPFQYGFQITPLCTVKDAAGAGNGITVTRGSNDNWQLVYWKSEAEANAKPGAPSTLSKGKTVTLSDGACFKIVFPRKTKGSHRFSWKMSFRPVKFLIVDGTVQAGEEFQDFGAWVYQGNRGVLNLNLSFQPAGSILIRKTNSQTGKPVAGAEYEVYAGEDIYSGGQLMHGKDRFVTKGITDEKGEILKADNLIPGKYYVKEKTAAPGYLLSQEVTALTVQPEKQTVVSVKDDPDIKGTVVVQKVIKDTVIDLADAEFTLYTWNRNTGKYESGVLLTYQSEQKRYISDTLVYTDRNQGKFKVTETRNPTGYTGNWSQEFQLTEPGTNRRFLYRVENSPVGERRIEIRKMDSQNGNYLEGAEFQLYPWSQSLGQYCLEGEPLSYDSSTMTYRSGILNITEENQGKFRVEETRNPEGYQGTWSRQVNLLEQNVSLQYTVKNNPIPKKEGVIRIKKRDAVTGAMVEGAGFSVYAWEQETKGYQKTETAVFSYDRQEQAYLSPKLEITKENQGRFLVRETKIPEGYQGSYQKEVTLTENGEVLELDAENQPIRLPEGEITITKKIKESEIIWAHGAPSFSFVITGKDLRGNVRTYEDSVVFMPGSYQKDAEGNAVMRVTIKHIPLGTYRIYEKQVLRYYLEWAQADTANVKIIKGKEAGYGKTPEETSYGTAELTLRHKTAALTFMNRKERYDGYSHNSFVENVIPFTASGEKE